MAKEQTNIRCPCSNFNNEKVLNKEYWGKDYKGEPQWHISCKVCGFSRIVSDGQLQIYIYCDSVMDV